MRERNKARMVLMVWVRVGIDDEKTMPHIKYRSRKFFPSISPTHTQSTHTSKSLDFFPLCDCIYRFMVVTKYKIQSNKERYSNENTFSIYLYIFFPRYFYSVYLFSVKLKMPCIESSNLNAKLEVNIVRLQTPTTCLSIFSTPKSFMFGRSVSVSCWHHYFLVIIVIIFRFQCPACYRVCSL